MNLLLESLLNLSVKNCVHTRNVKIVLCLKEALEISHGSIQEKIEGCLGPFTKFHLIKIILYTVPFHESKLFINFLSC